MTVRFKRYTYGLIVGRFQPFHHGHELMIARALDDCDKVVICIGSAQESRTSRNPFTVEERITLIKECFSEDLSRLIFVSLPDREVVRDDDTWGEYILNTIEHTAKVAVQAVFEGREACRQPWFNSIEELDIIQISRVNEPFSATDVRNALKEGNKDHYLAWCANNNESYYEDLRRIILDVEAKKINNHTSN